ncbi:ShlB/FhaC/HecB family hemolysin secretion/activation protein [Pseudomonas aeruginosa]
MRGFKDQTLTGDSGGYWRNQLRWRRAVERAAAALAAGIRRGLRLRRRRDPPRPLQRRRQRAHERQRHRTGCPRPLFRRQRRLRPLAGAAQRHRAARAPDPISGSTRSSEDAATSEL